MSFAVVGLLSLRKRVWLKMKAHIEHNLHDLELIEVLEKSLSAARQTVSNSERLRDKPMIDLAERWKGLFADQIGMMMKRIEGVING